MTTHANYESDRLKFEKGVSYPFQDISMRLLDELIEESRREIFQEKNNDNQEKNIN